MQYVYILTNVYVSDLVKFGFSTRDPHNRAVELSAPTGVPGRWTVYHYWEVEDGYAVEQAIFKRLKGYRLQRQEFFRLSASEAVRLISQHLEIVGTNPLEKARLEASALARSRQLEADRRERERNIALAERRAQDERRQSIIQEIAQEQAAVRAAMSKSDNFAFKAVTAAVFVIAMLANEGKGVLFAMLAGLGWVLLCYIFPVIPISIGLVKDDGKYHKQLAEIESRVLASHGVSTIKELEFQPQRRHG